MYYVELVAVVVEVEVVVVARAVVEEAVVQVAVVERPVHEHQARQVDLVLVLALVVRADLDTVAYLVHVLVVQLDERAIGQLDESFTVVLIDTSLNQTIIKISI